MAKENGEKRMTLVISEQASDLLKRLQVDTDARTDAEVLRRALRFYGWAVERIKNQNARFRLVRDTADGEVVTEVELLL